MEYLLLTVSLIIAGFFVTFLLLRKIIVRWLSDASQLDHVKQEMEKMLVELNHATGRNIDLIEERVGELKELLATVDKRIGLLRRDSEKHETGKAVYNKIVKTTPVPIIKSVQSEVPLSTRDKVLNLYHSGFSSSMIASQLQTSIGEVELIISLTQKD